MKMKLVALTLFSLVLPLGMNFAAATTETTNQTVVGGSEASEVHTTNNTINQQSAYLVTSKSAVTSAKAYAAGSAVSESGNNSTVTSSQTTGIYITQSQLYTAVSKVNSYIKKNNKLPSYVTVGDYQISMAQYLQLVTQGFINFNNGKSGNVVLDDVGAPSDPKSPNISGTIKESEYRKMAQSIIDYMDAHERAPNYISSSIGNIRYESLVFMFTKIVSFFDCNERMPTYVSVSPLGSEGSNITNPELKKYLVSTTNCQSTSSTIKNLAASITAGKTTTYAKAQAIFNWVRNNLTYSYYYNTKQGALGALSSRTANCCDHSHLVVALARASGIPARYQHGSCKFSGGWYGHVWAQMYVNGKWYYADAISNYNTFGAINNWSSVKLYGTYASLPF